jgi:catechol 2,3-dioxygenase-like lactoylglutathione lyase family enzyme
MTSARWCGLVHDRHPREDDMTATDAGSLVTGIRTVAVPVTDQDRALGFYTGTLGMEVRTDVPLGPARWIEVAPAGGSTSLALTPAEDGRPAGGDTGIRLMTTDATAAHAALAAGGADVDPEVLRWPGVPPMFVLRDGDGNRLTVVEQA